MMKVYCLPGQEDGLPKLQGLLAAGYDLQATEVKALTRRVCPPPIRADFRRQEGSLPGEPIIARKRRMYTRRLKCERYVL